METRRVHFTELAPAAPTSLHAREWETYRREVGRLLAEGHAGEFVLIHGDDIVGFWPTWKAAVVEGYRRFRSNQFLTRAVTEWDEVRVIPYRGQVRWVGTAEPSPSAMAANSASPSSSAPTATIPKH
jgi:hypothetical protein